MAKQYKIHKCYKCSFIYPVYIRTCLGRKKIIIKMYVYDLLAHNYQQYLSVDPACHYSWLSLDNPLHKGSCIHMFELLIFLNTSPNHTYFSFWHWFLWLIENWHHPVLKDSKFVHPHAARSIFLDSPQLLRAGLNQWYFILGKFHEKF